MLRRKRLPDGTLGPLEDVFGEPTQEEQIMQLEASNALLVYDSMMSALKFDEVKTSQADLIYQLMTKGVL